MVRARGRISAVKAGWVTPALALLLAGCTVFGIPLCGNGKLNLSHASLNPTSFTCPANANDLGYDIKGTVDADNETTHKITIKSMSTAAVVDHLAGNWGMAVGDESGANDIDFSPKSIGSGQQTTFKFTTVWNCSNSGNNQQDTYADFKVQLIMETDNGEYKVNLPEHRMVMA